METISIGGLKWCVPFHSSQNFAFLALYCSLRFDYGNTISELKNATNAKAICQREPWRERIEPCGGATFECFAFDAYS
jgi:hypothetical protein